VSEGLAITLLMLLQEKNPVGFRTVYEVPRELVEKNKDSLAPIRRAVHPGRAAALVRILRKDTKLAAMGRGTWLFHMLAYQFCSRGQLQEPFHKAVNRGRPFVRALSQAPPAL